MVLDLNMDISDGYETCKNIVNLYKSNNKMFKIQKNQNEQEQDSFNEVSKRVDNDEP